MLVLRHVQLRPRRLPAFPPRHGQSPANRRYFIQNLCDGFLDLAIALPIPPSLPPYSTTIILTTILARFALLPVSIWGKQRAWRMEEQAIPELERMKPIVSKQVLEEMKSKGIHGDKTYLQEVHKKRSIEVLSNLRKNLFKKYKCRPLPTILVPPLTQLPVFILGTIMLGRLSLDPTPFDSESFLTLSTLAHPDPTMTLPIILGVATMANVESSNWVMNAAERERERQIEEQNAKILAAGGKPQIRPRALIKSGLRVLSIGRIIIAAVAPGSVTLFWLTSATFGLIQTWIIDWLDIRRRRRNAAARIQTVSAPPRPALRTRPKLSRSQEVKRS
ncbi:putative 60Kd inner membrane protein [Lyophyllum shimeji]|uniref:60Kd inner membrane protein n=1 Tax=Lyophyllum shimeji TaxID=47721 RepID=A0A9P3PED2_LYOSH|nr:putative 60Kd inner membrane protein [Lyophyllum shimeji]